MTLPVFLDGFMVGTSELHQTGANVFETLGVPNNKVENWHYTNLQKMLKNETYNAKTGKSPTPRQLEDVHTIVIDCGVFTALDTGQDNISGITISGINDAKVGSIAQTDTHSMASLNTALYTDGVYINFSKSCEKPIHFAFVNSGEKLAVFPRIFVNLESGIEATIVETFESIADSKIFVNSVMEINVSQGATLNHYRVLEDESDIKNIGYTEVAVAGQASYTQTGIAVSEGHIRNETRITLNGEKAYAKVQGVYLTNKEQSVDNTVHIRHNAPDCVSEQLFKGILDDTSKGIFQGKIHVDQIAQLTDGYQMHRSILLSRDAEVSCKPELEIYADDVKCSHGATTGEIDSEQLFYLMARGIDKKQAEQMLLQAFVMEVLDDVENVEIQKTLSTLIINKSLDMFG